MKEISYWDQFMSSGRVEDYLKFKEQDQGKEYSERETYRAGLNSCNRDDYQGSAYR